MAKRIVWSANAIADRIDILDYWYKRIGNKYYSIRLDKSLKEIINKISIFPEIGRKKEDLNIRYFIKEHYKVYYCVDEQEILILHIWDSRRNPENLLVFE